MKSVHADIIQFRGGHYQFGLFQAEKLKNSPIINHRKALLSKRWRNFLVDEEEVKAVFKAFSPAIWEEIEGLSDGLGIPWNDAIREFGGYYYEYGRSGCSINTKQDYLVRNYDNAPIPMKAVMFYSLPLIPDMPVSVLPCKSPGVRTESMKKG